MEAEGNSEFAWNMARKTVGWEVESARSSNKEHKKSFAPSCERVVQQQRSFAEIA